MTNITLTRDGTQAPLSLDVPSKLTVAGLIEHLRDNETQLDEPLFVYRDDQDEHLLQEVLLDLEAIDEVLHIARHKAIEVSVHWQTKSFTQNFAPSVRIKRIRREAIDYFTIPQADAAKLVLVVSGQTEPLDVLARIGTVAQDCKVNLDLVPAEKIQG